MLFSIIKILHSKWDEISYIKCNNGAMFFRGSSKYFIIRSSFKPIFANMNNIEPLLAQKSCKINPNMLVKK